MTNTAITGGLCSEVTTDTAGGPTLALACATRRITIARGLACLQA
jgi:hypothetical protein